MIRVDKNIISKSIAIGNFFIMYLLLSVLKFGLIIRALIF